MARYLTSQFSVSAARVFFIQFRFQSCISKNVPSREKLATSTDNFRESGRYIWEKYFLMSTGAQAILKHVYWSDKIFSRKQARRVIRLSTLAMWWVRWLLRREQGRTYPLGKVGNRLGPPAARGLLDNSGSLWKCRNSFSMALITGCKYRPIICM